MVDLKKIHETAKRAADDIAKWPEWKKEASTPKVVSYESALEVAARSVPKAAARNENTILKVLDDQLDHILKCPGMYAVETAQGMESMLRMLLYLRWQFFEVPEKSEQTRFFLDTYGLWMREFFKKHTGNAVAFTLLKEYAWDDIVGFYAELVRRTREEQEGYPRRFETGK